MTTLGAQQRRTSEAFTRPRGYLSSMNPSRYLPRPLPAELEGLVTLALDLRWAWGNGAEELWAQLDAELWRRLGNPWLILETVSQVRLEQLAQDPSFLEKLRLHLEARERRLQRPTWWSSAPGTSSLGAAAFFRSSSWASAAGASSTRWASSARSVT